MPVVDLELADPASVAVPNALGQVVVLVRLHGTPLGALNLLAPDPGRTTVDLRARACEELAGPLVEHLRLDGLMPSDLDAPAAGRPPCVLRPPPSATVSVVVCSLGRDARLGGAVASVLRQRHAPLELLVVDNDPASGRVRALLEGVLDPRLRVVEEPRRGLSAARNAGIGAARGTVVAFTDDDAEADPGWLERLLAPFDLDEDVVCTTGLVLPASLGTPAQAWFEEYGAFDKGFEPTVWTLGEPVPAVAAAARRGHGGTLFPYAAGVYGSGTTWRSGCRG